MQFETANGVLIARNGGEMLRIEPWGKNSLRVRALLTSVNLPLSQMDASAPLLTLQALSHFTVTASSFYASIIAATMAH